MGNRGYVPSEPLSGRKRSHIWVVFAALALLLLIVKEGAIDRSENLFRARRFDPTVPGGGIVGTRIDTAINYGNAYTLHGYDLPRTPVTAGDPIRVDLFLSARQPQEGPREHLAFTRLVDEEGRLWSPPHSSVPEGHRPPPPTTLWPTDAYGHWAYEVRTLPGTPPGRYWVQVGLFERDTWKGLNVLDEAGNLASLSARIGPVEIARPGQAPTLEELDLDQASSTLAAPGLRLLGSKLDAEPQRAGEPLDITLFWQALDPVPADYQVRLDLLSGQEHLALAEGLPLGRADHPTSAWVGGEIVRSPHVLRVPASAPAGAYVVEATVVDAAGQAASDALPVARGMLEPTDRQMNAPKAMRRQIDADLGGQATLLGYDLPVSGETLRLVAGDTLPVTLYWQAQSEMQTSYKVFLQLVGPNGVLAQADAIPGEWQRPTTGWMTGEVIVDPHALSLPAGAPAGEYTLIAGMYDETTLQRLPLLDAFGAVSGDHSVLEKVVLE